MRICLYTETALPRIGGQQLVVDALARHLQSEGHEVTVLTQDPPHPLESADGTLPYAVVRHPRFMSTQHLVWWYRYFLLRLQRRKQFDVIHCHSVYPTGWLAGLNKEKLGVPVVITSHGGDVREGNPRLSKGRLGTRYEESLRRADALISMSRFTYDGYMRLYPGAQNIVSIPNGVDLDAFAGRAPRPARLPESVRAGTYALFMGRLAQQKGVDLLLEAMTKLPARGGVELVIAGDGEEREALEAQAKRLGLNGRVYFGGAMMGAEKVYLFQNAMFTVMASRRAEAFPLVVLESYAAGKPLIGTRIPGLQDLVRSGETGLLVNEESPAELAEAMRGLFADPARVTAMGEEGRRFAADYGWPSVARRHVELYERLQARVHS